MCYNDSDNVQETELSETQRTTLARELENGFHSHMEHARTLDQCAKSGGNAMLSAKVASQLAAEHRTMAATSAKLRDLLKRASAVWVQTEE